MLHKKAPAFRRGLEGYELLFFLCGADDVQFIELLLRDPQTAGAVRGPP